MYPDGIGPHGSVSYSDCIGVSVSYSVPSGRTEYIVPSIPSGNYFDGVCLQLVFTVNQRQLKL